MGCKHVRVKMDNYEKSKTEGQMMERNDKRNIKRTKRKLVEENVGDNNEMQ